METRITTDFLSSLAILNKNEQKRGIETIKKISNDLISSGLRDHKIQHQSNQIYSFSINMDLRMIVHKNNNIITYLYVAHHDDAYDWISKRKVLDLGNDKFKIIVPLNLESDKDEYYNDKKEVESKKSNKEIYELINGYINEDEALNYIAEQDSNIQDDLLKFWINKTRNYKVIPEYKIKIINGDEELEKALEFPLEQWRIFLHPKQELISKRKITESVYITGGPGSGKTICLIHSIKSFMSEINKDECIILTTFKEGLQDYLENMLKLLNCNYSNVFIDDVNSLKIIKGEFKLSNNLDGLYKIEGEELFYYSSNKKYRVKHILFDEYQDFNKSQIDLISEISKIVNHTIAFDYTQTIYRPLKQDILAIAKSENIPVIQLNYCYRINSNILNNLKNIVRVIKIISTDDSSKSMVFNEIENEIINNSISVFKGPPVILQEFSDKNNITDLLSKDVEFLKSKYEESDFVITSFFEENYMILNENENYFAEKFDIKYRKFYKFLPTLKGKEFKAGIIILDDSICQMLNINILVHKKKIETNFKGGSEHYRRNLNLLYVALSRFRDFVKIYYPKEYEIIIKPIFD